MSAVDQLYAEMVNRWTKLTGTVDPNTLSGYDGAPIGITYVRTGTDPVVVWIKNRAGSPGWDLYAPGGGGGSSKQSWIIVGNSGAGDTAAICDYLDTGNGAQLAAGIAAANIARQSVYVRPGRYDFSLPGSPLPADMPIVVNCVVVGAGRRGPSSTPSVIISSKTADKINMFNVVLQYGRLQDLAIELQLPTADCSNTTNYLIAGVYEGTYTAEGTNCPAALRNVDVFVPESTAWTAAHVNWLPSYFYGLIGPMWAEDCRVGGQQLWAGVRRCLPAFNNLVVGRYVSCFGGGALRNCAAYGGDHTYWLRSTLTIGSHRLLNCVGRNDELGSTILYIPSPSGVYALIHGSEFIRNTALVPRAMILNEASYVRFLANDVVCSNSYGASAYGIDNAASYCLFDQNRLKGINSIMRVGANNNIWGLNRLEGAATLTSSGTSNTKPSMVAL